MTDLPHLAPSAVSNSRLRIAFCLSHFWPEESGAERQARRQAKELSRRGHQVTVITRARPGLPEEEVADGIAIRRIIKTWNVGPLFGLSFIRNLSGYLTSHREQFDLIHCHQGLWEATAAGMVHRKTGIPTVIQPAAGGPFGEVEVLKKTKGKFLLRKQILKNGAFVAISQQIADELSELGVTPEKIHLIGSGVDLDEFSPGPSSVEGDLPAGPRVLFLGRLHPQKNLRRLLEAWSQLPPSTPGVLLLAGDGPQQVELTLLSKQLKLGERVQFLGTVEDVVAYLRAADIFVLPSHSEGMSNSLLEAMACGLPPIVASTAGSADLVSHRQSGLVIDSRQVGELRDALQLFIEDRELRETCGLRAREFIRDHFALTSIVDRYESLYRTLLDANR